MTRTPLLVPAWLVAVLYLAASACAADPAATTSVGEIVSAVPDQTERAARLLADAAAASESDPTRLAALLGVIEGQGIHSAEGNADDLLPAWRAQAAAQTGVPVPLRGRALGPAYQSGWLEPNSSKRIEQIFLAGEAAKIALSSPTKTPLDIDVSGPDAKNVCRQNAQINGRCEWMAIYTQRFSIEIRNPGSKRVRYFLVTN